MWYLIGSAASFGQIRSRVATLLDEEESNALGLLLTSLSISFHFGLCCISSYISALYHASLLVFIGSYTQKVVFMRSYTVLNRLVTSVFSLPSLA